MKKKRYKLPPVKPVFYGGQQEHGIRPGTTPVALVAGMGKACEIALESFEQNTIILLKLKELVLSEIKNSGVLFTINGVQDHCIANTVNVQFVGILLKH